jgi:putative flippase GtrA
MMQGRRSDTNVIVNGRAGKEAGTAKRRYLLYMLCAAVSTVMNLGSQALVKIVFRHADPPSGEAAGRGIAAVAASVTLFGLPLSFIIQLAVGTGLGLISKFLLDKFLVFKDSYQGLGKTVRQLLFYSLLAVITTLVFWGFEVGFRLAFSFPYADIAGGLIGLIIGYTIKYYLDRRFIFR